MNKVTDKKQFILDALSDGRFHSGEELGKLLGVSRTAIAKHIKGLADLGVDIYRVTGKGYRLSNSFTLLNYDQIRSHYENLTRQELKLNVESVTSSTNTHILSLIRGNAALERGYTVIAECQTAGRGRRGRQWVSPFGAHLYLSMYWRLNGVQEAMGLSLAVGLAVRAAIAQTAGIEAQLKWPNDLLVKDKKVAGVLVELEGQADGPCDVVVGVGINVKMPLRQGETIDQPWTDLSLESSQEVDRNNLCAALIHQLVVTLDTYEKYGLQQLVSEWNRFDAFNGQPVKLSLGKEQITGISQGIDKQGGIILRHDNETKVYYGGEVSLRAVKDELVY